MTDAKVVAAMTFLFEPLKAVVEPSGTGALSAVLAGKAAASAARIGVGLTGGNVSASRFYDLISTA